MLSSSYISASYFVLSFWSALKNYVEWITKRQLEDVYGCTFVWEPLVIVLSEVLIRNIESLKLFFVLYNWYVYLLQWLALIQVFTNLYILPRLSEVSSVTSSSETLSIPNANAQRLRSKKTFPIYFLGNSWIMIDLSLFSQKQHTKIEKESVLPWQSMPGLPPTFAEFSQFPINSRIRYD